jgi:hypothetical protein
MFKNLQYASRVISTLRTYSIIQIDFIRKQLQLTDICNKTQRLLCEAVSEFLKITFLISEKSDGYVLLGSSSIPGRDKISFSPSTAERWLWATTSLKRNSMNGVLYSREGQRGRTVRGCTVYSILPGQEFYKQNSIIHTFSWRSASFTEHTQIHLPFIL